MRPAHNAIGVNQIIDINTDVRYTPYFKDGRAGLMCEKPGQKPVYIYLNPSINDPGDDTEANVFLYIGPYNDPAHDDAQHHYVINHDDQTQGI